jgi:potassium uptake TrkH family protein
MRNRIHPYLIYFSLILLLWDVGFKHAKATLEYIYITYLGIIVLSLVFEIVDFFRLNKGEKWKPFLRGILPLLTVFSILISLVQGFPFIVAVSNASGLFIFNVILLLSVEIGLFSDRLYAKKNIKPSIVLAGSFLFLILIGTILLKLPRATTAGISWVDAAFTATSAVSVTGLSINDTGKSFTLFGHIVILILIQLGGLSMLVFTSFFSYFFKGKASYRENTYLSDFLGSNQFSDLLGLAKKVVVFTMLTELIGTFFIYINLPPIPAGNSIQERVFFSIFHAVSSFCNAGFSLLGNNLYDPFLRYNYNIHLVIACLLVFGGLGYAIHFNVADFLKSKFYSIISKYKKTAYSIDYAHVRLSLNAKIVLRTTFILIVLGWISFLLLEWNRPTMQEHPTLFGKMVVSLFGSVTPRTAGFNTVDMAGLSTPFIFMTIMLMWVGASPASTGGGIKTSTFAVAILNIYHSLTGREKIHVANREIEQQSVNRAFAIIFLSLIIIGAAILLLSILEPAMDFLSLCFEVFSAYSTVGLSLGVTATFSDAGKIILMAVMFIGRVGIFSILSGLLAHREPPAYDFPEDSILIN